MCVPRTPLLGCTAAACRRRALVLAAALLVAAMLLVLWLLDGPARHPVAAAPAALRHEHEEVPRGAWCAGAPLRSDRVAALLWDPQTDARTPLHADGTEAASCMDSSLRDPRWPSARAPALAPEHHDAVVAYADGYSAEQLSEFVWSWVRFGASGGNAVLYVFGRSDPTGALPRDAPVRFVDVLPVLDTLEAEGVPASAVRSAPVFARFWVVGRWLADCSESIGVLLWVDARDVRFQGDPFAPLRSAGVVDGFFGVAEQYMLRTDSHYNQPWLRAIGGADVVDEILGLPQRPWRPEALGAHARFGDHVPLYDGEVPIICAGLFGADARAMLDYLMLASVPAQTGCIHRAKYTDQGTHNYIMWLAMRAAGYPHRARLLDPRVAPLTNTVEPPNQMVTADDRLVNCVGAAYAAHHQMDRYADLWRRLNAHNAPP